MRHVKFPACYLPLTYVVAALFDLLIASPVLLGLMLYYRISGNGAVGVLERL